MSASDIINANALVEEQLDRLCECLETETSSDVLSYCGSIYFGADDVVRDTIEWRQKHREQSHDKLVVMLETTGGYIEVVRRIVDTVRRHYSRVEFIVPNYALSAGTVLVLSGDDFHMDYYSVLGPIDPQVGRPDGSHVSAIGYLVQYERLVKKSQHGNLTTAELTFLVEKFDPAELYHYEQARELSVSLLKDWLVTYKFRNWKKTRTRKKTVTAAMRRRRAGQIAKILNDTDRWHSHGHGISMEVLRRDLKLEVNDFGGSQKLNDCVRDYHRLFVDYMRKRGHVGAVHVRGRLVPLVA